MSVGMCEMGVPFLGVGDSDQERQRDVQFCFIYQRRDSYFFFFSGAGRVRDSFIVMYRNHGWLVV